MAQNVWVCFKCEAVCNLFSLTLLQIESLRVWSGWSKQQQQTYPTTEKKQAI